MIKEKLLVCYPVAKWQSNRLDGFLLPKEGMREKENGDSAIGIYLFVKKGTCSECLEACVRP